MDTFLSHWVCYVHLSYVVDANGMESKDSHGTTCRLQTMSDILKTIFRDGNTSHAKYYRVSSAIVHQISLVYWLPLLERRYLSSPLLLHVDCRYMFKSV